MIESPEKELAELQNKYDKAMEFLNRVQVKYDGMNVRYKSEIGKNAKLVKQYEGAVTNAKKLQTKYVGMTARYNKQININEILVKKNDDLIKKFENDKIKLKGMIARNERLILELNENKNGIEKLKRSLSYRWGNRVIKSKGSFVSLIRLPYDLFKEYKDFKGEDKIVAKISDLQKTRLMSEKYNIECALNLKELKVASIMDEFTFNSFRHECNLLQLSPHDWKRELEQFKPDLVFIESAWKGKDDLWERKISNCTSELVEMVQFCHENKIQTMFWNKEDPVHFDTFIPVAKIVDHVFTTDIDCVPRYKKEVGHNNVYLLPFAAQPLKHNPIEIYKRKDAFNFAGSYYLRYPERQRDFESLIEAVKKFKAVDIYDRNFDNPHPHYQFPEKYKSMILGRLPFEDIDKAYKGYRYGINMNTIKQSQSMFARRVFELLASNTVVVSNFSRGMRQLFGELVISSDDSGQLASLLGKLCNNEEYYRKLRLLGLRKVMSEHTYADRLSFILSKINNKTFAKAQPLVYLYGVAKNKVELDHIVQAFRKQKYKNKKLLLWQKFECRENIAEDNIVVDTKISRHLKLLMESNNDVLFGVIDSSDYYGDHYLTDLAYASFYSDCNVYGKKSFYECSDDLILNNDGQQYKKTAFLDIRSSLIKLKSFDEKTIKRFLKNEFSISGHKMLAIDEFNYCKYGRNAPEEVLKKVDDLKLVDQGISFSENLAIVSNNLPAKERLIKDASSIPSLNAKELYDNFAKPGSSKIRIEFISGKLQIATKLGEGKHAYIYLKKVYAREKLNMVLNSQFTLNCKSTLQDFRTVFEFQDKDGVKISHSMNPAGETHAIAIPTDCVYIRFGLKLVGNGRADISELVLGTHGEVPFAIVGKSKKLVLTKQYPSYDDIYKYGFLHSRVRAYKKEGVLVDIFRINNQPSSPFREFENINVATGDAALLDATLKTGQYDHVLVHLIDEHMWKVLLNHIDKIKVTVWVHGAEIQVWQQRSFEFVGLSAEEIERQKKLSNNRVKFWNNLVRANYENLSFVFVSKWLLESAQEHLKVNFNPGKYSIIHNNIDDSIFDYSEKQEQDRLNILSIRPYAKRVYANDLTAKAIMLLSKKEYFNQLNFRIIGDGDLFDETVKPLRRFKNVKIQQGFLQQHEISKEHKQNGILLVPTRMDTQGVSRDEAMSSGLVAVTTCVAAIPEFVDANCGMVVEPENAEALAEAIDYLYHNPKRFLELSNSASERVQRQSGVSQTILKEIEKIQKST